MKAAVFFVVAAAFITLIVAEVNWDDVGKKVTEIEEVVRGTAKEIKELAGKEEKDAGANIVKMIGEWAPKAEEILKDAESSLKDKSMTEEKAKAFLKKVHEDVDKLKENVSPELTKLSDAAVTKIRQLFGQANTNTDAKAEELYALLKA